MTDNPQEQPPITKEFIAQLTPAEYNKLPRARQREISQRLINKTLQQDGTPSSPSKKEKQ